MPGLTPTEKVSITSHYLLCGYSLLLYYKLIFYKEIKHVVISLKYQVPTNI